MTARGVLLGAGGRHRGWLRYAGYALLALVAFGFIAAPAQNAQPSDLVAAYAFDEGAGTSVTDLSGNGNAGQIGSATWTTSGKFGRRVELQRFERAGDGAGCGVVAFVGGDDVGGVGVSDDAYECVA